MLINSVIIILREVLEAALIVSVLLALCQILQLSRRFFIPSFVLGGLLAIVYGTNIAFISMLFEGVGQEILNATLHFITFTCRNYETQPRNLRRTLPPIKHPARPNPLHR